MTDKPGWWPAFLPFSAAMLILWAPGGFRFTCYYYRGAYYKAFWADPVSCTVGEPRKILLGRAQVPADHSKHPPLFPVLRDHLHRDPGHDAYKAMWFDGTFRHRRRDPGHDHQPDSARQLHVRLPFAASPGRRTHRRDVEEAGAQVLLRLRVLPQSKAHAVGVDQPVLGRLHRRLHPPLRHGHLARTGGSSRWRTIRYHEFDVLVVGAGGAGLRAAIEASAAGVKVGVVSKSLLGKAHTVMAEGGMAAAMGNVDDRDNWRVHFADTMRGGQYLNNCRMAELHAKEAPARVRELEAWGAMFDRTKDGKILQRNFGGHRYPRLAHVGDRTGLEMIRTLQDHGIHQGIEFHMETTILTLLKDGDRCVGAFGLRSRTRALQALSRQSRRAGHRRHRPRVLRSPATAGNTPATATRSPITPARRCSTWSSSSSIRPGWSGRPAFTEFW